jgi:hypothetical protein
VAQKLSQLSDRINLASQTQSQAWNPSWHLPG